MYRAQPIIFCNYLGYDEVGHYAGPETKDALASLPGIDRQIRQIAQAAREAPRPYQIVVFSDHGMTTGHLFKTVYGKPLDELVRELIKADSAVLLSGAKDEGLGHISGFLNELSQSKNMAGRGARRLLGDGEGDRPVDLTSYREARREGSKRRSGRDQLGEPGARLFRSGAGAAESGAGHDHVPGPDRGARGP